MLTFLKDLSNSSSFYKSDLKLTSQNDYSVQKKNDLKDDIIDKENFI